MRISAPPVRAYDITKLAQCSPALVRRHKMWGSTGFELDKTAMKAMVVSTTGDDTLGTGSLSSPFKTWRKALDTGGPGCRILLRGGEYQEFWQCAYQGDTFIGDVGLPVLTQPYNDEHVVLHETSGAYAFVEIGYHAGPFWFWGIDFQWAGVGLTDYANNTGARCDVFKFWNGGHMVYDCSFNNWTAQAVNIQNDAESKLSGIGNSDYCWVIGNYFNDGGLAITNPPVTSIGGCCYTNCRGILFAGNTVYKNRIGFGIEIQNNSPNPIDSVQAVRVVGNRFLEIGNDGGNNKGNVMIATNAIAGRIDVIQNLFVHSCLEGASSIAPISVTNDLTNTNVVVKVEKNTIHDHRSGSAAIRLLGYGPLYFLRANVIDSPGNANGSFVSLPNGGSMAGKIVASDNYYCNAGNKTYGWQYGATTYAGTAAGWASYLAAVRLDVGAGFELNSVVDLVNTPAWEDSTNADTRLRVYRTTTAALKNRTIQSDNGTYTHFTDNLLESMNASYLGTGPDIGCMEGT